MIERLDQQATSTEKSEMEKDSQTFFLLLIEKEKRNFLLASESFKTKIVKLLMMKQRNCKQMKRNYRTTMRDGKCPHT